jgi:hypothetical protein
MNAPATWIVPSRLQGMLSGVAVIVVGARVIKCQLHATAYRFARKHLPRVLPTDFAELAELVRRAAREHGTEIDPILQGPRA